MIIVVGVIHSQYVLEDVSFGANLKLGGTERQKYIYMQKNS